MNEPTNEPDANATIPEYLTADQAIEAIHRCAFDAGDENGPDLIVHCFSGGMGADWSVESAIATVRNAYVHDGVPQIAWAPGLLGRCLHVVERISNEGGRTRVFDTVVPA